MGAGFFSKWATKHEGERLVRFVLVGGTSFLIHAGVYLLLSRWLWAEGDRLLIQIAAIAFAVLFNFFAHRTWTYGSNGRLRAEATRYLLVVLSASGLQAGIFWLAYERLGVFDLLSVVLAGAVSAVYTFIVHRIFTFRSEPPNDDDLFVVI